MLLQIRISLLQSLAHMTLLTLSSSHLPQCIHILFQICSFLVSVIVGSKVIRSGQCGNYGIFSIQGRKCQKMSGGEW